jgi:hypothetical protein
LSLISGRDVRILADLNHDGYPDIIGFGDDGVWTALGKGDGTFQTQQFPLDYFACNARFDFNVERTQTDPNGFLFNPQWRWQVYHPNTGTPNPKTHTPYAAMCDYFTRWSNPSPNEFVPHPSFSDCTDQTHIVNVPDSFPNSSICSAGNNSGFPGHVNWFTARLGPRLGFRVPLADLLADL